MSVSLCFIRQLCLAWQFLHADWLSLLSKSQVAIRDSADGFDEKSMFGRWTDSLHELDAGRGHVGSRHFWNMYLDQELVIVI